MKREAEATWASERVENALLRVVGVRNGAVVVNKHLVAFYAGDRPLDSAAIRDKLAVALREEL